MTTKGFSVQHARDAHFERGLRPYLEYRYLGIKEATEGRVVAWHLRKIPGVPFPAGQPHLHRTSFQLVYVLKGWIRFVYEGQGEHLFREGDCVLQPAAIVHNELECSDDVEILEIYSPAVHETRVVHTLPEAAATR